MTPKQSDATLSRYLGDTLMEGSIRLIGGIAALALITSIIVYIV